MAQARTPCRPLSERQAELFATAEEAWMWFSRCQIARREGVRFVADVGICRPCDPDDIYREVLRLHRRRILDGAHLAVLGRFGMRLMHPEHLEDNTPGEASLWEEALDRLTTVLRIKGIVS